MQSDELRFFKLERAIENLPSSSILIASLCRQIGLSSATEFETSQNAIKLIDAINNQLQIGKEFNNEELLKAEQSKLVRIN